MVAFPQWLLGKHLTTVTLFAQSVSTAGVLTDAATSAFATVVDSIGLNMSPTVENINAVNVPRANNVVVEDDASLQLSIIQRNDTADPDALGALVAAYDYFKGTFTVGGVTPKTWTGYFSRGQYNTGIQGKGKQTSSLELHIIDTGTSNYLVRS